MKILAIIAASSCLSVLQAHAAELNFTPLPNQPQDVEWPTTEWPRSELPAGASRSAIEAIADEFMDGASEEELGVTHALVIIQGGRIVLERYADGYSCEGIAHTMSIAKMMGAVMAGLMHRDGLIDVNAPAEISEWRKKSDDPRADITHAQILQMTGGQKWNEAFDFLNLAFGRGHANLAEYAIEKPIAHAPGTHFQYSDGAPGLIGYILKNKLGGGAENVVDYVQENLFSPLGMTHTELEFDKEGAWYGSSGVRWSPCDLARFSQLLLRDGIWDGRRILPEGWVDFMRAPTPPSLAPESDLRKHYEAAYGLTAFVYDVDFEAEQVEVDAFGHLGFGGHVLKIIPSKDAAILLYGAKAFGDDFIRRINNVHALGDALPVPARKHAPADTP